MNVLFEDKQKVDSIGNKYNSRLSSHAFQSMYLWRDKMEITSHIEENLYSAKCGFMGNEAWFFPCGEDGKKYEFIKSKIGLPNFKLCYMEECDVEFLRKNFPGIFKFERNETADEYIYSIEEHRRLAGKNYANVRTQYNKIKREHDLYTEIITDSNVNTAIDILSKWELQKHGDAPLNDEGVDEEALMLRRELDICGVIVFVDEEPMAVSAGFPLTADTFDVCIAKSIADTPGLAYYAKRELFLSLPESYKYINLEEDLGMEGLIKMKSILHPIRKNEIWEATVIE